MQLGPFRRRHLPAVLAPVLAGGLLALAGCMGAPQPAAGPSTPPPPPPPAIPPEDIPKPPVSEAPLIWQPGHWDLSNLRYIWREGRWIPRGDHSTQWQPGYWANEDGTWRWVPAHWL
jgi:hypothetical protein